MFRIQIDALMPNGSMKTIELFTEGKLYEVLEHKVPHLVVDNAKERGYKLASIKVFDSEGNQVDESFLNLNW